MPDLTGDVYYAPAGGARPYEKVSDHGFFVSSAFIALSASDASSSLMPPGAASEAAGAASSWRAADDDAWSGFVAAGGGGRSQCVVRVLWST